MLVLVGASLVLFAREVLPLEVTALSLLVALLLCGYIDASQAVSGLSNKAVVTIGAMLVLGQALVHSGFVEQAAERLERLAGSRRSLGIVLLLVGAALASGVLNNTAIVAIFIPLALDLCRRMRISPSRVLMPLSFAAIFGGTLTLIGTSTNLIVSAIAEEHGIAPLGMFEFAPLGGVMLAVGLVYIVVVGPRLLPARVVPDHPERTYGMRPYLTELRVTEESELIGESAETAQIGPLYDVSILAIVRGEETLTRNVGVVPFRAGDTLIVRASVDGLMRMRDELHLVLLPDVKIGEQELTQRGLVIVEAVVPPASRLIGRTLAAVDFRRAYGAFVMAIRRRGRTLHSRVARTPLRFADGLLLIGPVARVRALMSDESLVITTRLPPAPPRGVRRWGIVVVLPAVVLSAALGVADILVAALVGVVALFAMRALRPREAYRAVEWPVLILIAAFVPVGLAMESTGTAAYLAQVILSVQGVLPKAAAAWIMVGLVYAATSMLTETVSNNATAILVAPIAIEIAHFVEADPRPFLFAVCFAASAAFLTPHGYQTNMMVYGPGGYRFMDYVRFGAPLEIGMWLVAWALIPLIWPL